MKARDTSLWWIFERVVPWVVLLILLTYSYAKFFRHSYGFRVDPSTALVVNVFDQQPEPTLRVNDRILQIGSARWEDFESDLARSLFEGYQPGDTVPLRVERNNEQINISWEYPGSNPKEFLDQLNSEWWFAYFLWLAGFLTVTFVRPRDASWVLMALFNFLTAIWLIAGSGLSAYHIWYSAIVLRAAVWLCLPVYLHLHWVFPRPLGKLPRWLLWTVYGIGIMLAIAQVFQLLDPTLYLLGFLLALGGSFVLLVIHYWRQPSIRRDFRLLLIVLILAVVPPMIWVFIDTIFGISPLWGAFGIISLPLLSFAYLYTAFRRRLGNLELRVNRFFTICLFLILLLFFGLLFIAILDRLPETPGKTITIGFISLLLSVAAFLGTYPAFERFVDQSIFGVVPTSKRLLESFSSHITTSVALPDLIRVLQEEVLPSLLIRQFAFLHYDQGSLNVLSTTGLDNESLPQEKDVSDLLARGSIYRSADLADAAQRQPFDWKHLVLPLRLSDKLIGFWLLGRRDPDDYYSQQDILTLTSLANLTAIALSNILQTERLTSMYHGNIDRYEQERVSVARDLHDSILNELAALPIRGDAPFFSPAFQAAYDDVSDHLREIIRDLRPTMLSFGLKLALESYAENLRQRNPDAVEILAIIDGESRYPLMIESNVYRIVQEACENSLRYAHAKQLSISGALAEQQIRLRIADDGMGLDPDTSLNFNDLLTHKHYGLAGMHERANIIDAELRIESLPNQGTQIHITWMMKDLH